MRPVGQGVPSFFDQGVDGFCLLLLLAYFLDLLQNHLLGQFALAGGGGVTRRLLQGLGRFFGEMSHAEQGFDFGSGQPLWGGIPFQQFEHPLGGEIFGVDGQFGKDSGQQPVELIDRSGSLFGGGFGHGDDVAQLGKLGRVVGRGRRLFDDGESGAGHALDGIGFPLVVMGLSIGFVFGGIRIIYFVLVLSKSIYHFRRNHP